MLNRDSSVKSTWLHCSGVLMRCSLAQCNRVLTCDGDKGTQTTGRRAKSPASCSLLNTVWRYMGLPAAAYGCDTNYRAGTMNINLYIRDPAEFYIPDEEAGHRVADSNQRTSDHHAADVRRAYLGIIVNQLVAT
ncbi:hypothetical protein AVEN_244280-1 [Araneus ventricosus]|uniref:Uncharacterized protein n=1 Tax=Araneus ventricosus TaxID=182803 RepID=A0A4Y2LKR6_ARAVE|nr:hypothetical protein AVEN_244280-1 [Araneus ventricosus]